VNYIQKHAEPAPQKAIIRLRGQAVILDSALFAHNKKGGPAISPTARHLLHTAKRAAPIVKECLGELSKVET
jgi:hypothetical protein